MENMVGLGRLELPTLRLSGVRSNHLSYRPLGLRRLLALSCATLEKEKRRRRMSRISELEAPYLFYDEPI